VGLLYLPNHLCCYLADVSEGVSVANKAPLDCGTSRFLGFPKPVKEAQFIAADKEHILSNPKVFQHW
jgi:hypothetical protein